MEFAVKFSFCYTTLHSTLHSSFSFNLGKLRSAGDYFFYLF